jgi:hypothetical protein
MPRRKMTGPRATLFLIDAEIHKSLRKAAMESGVSMAAALREAAQMWLRRQEKAAPERRSNGTAITVH